MQFGQLVQLHPCEALHRAHRKAPCLGQLDRLPGLWVPENHIASTALFRGEPHTGSRFISRRLMVVVTTAAPLLIVFL